jgi:hypothetical protein
MDVAMWSARCLRRRWLDVAGIVLVATLAQGAGAAADDRTKPATDVAVKAAFLHNFAKFTEWPALARGARIVFCIVGNDGIAAALVEMTRGRNIESHMLEIRQTQDGDAWPACHLLFVAEAESRRSAGGLSAVKTLPVLTVSDGKGFSQEGGIIEFYVDGVTIRFAINVDAAERSRLRISSRLLALARVVHNDRVR